MDRQLAGSRAEQITADADVVAQVEQLVERESLLADRVEPHVNLQPRAVLLQRGEAGLALRRMAMMRPATATVIALGLQLLAGRRVPLGAHRGIGACVCERELVGIGRLPQLLNLFQLFLRRSKDLAQIPSRTLCIL